MSATPHASEIPILVQSEFWADKMDHAVAVVSWIKCRIADRDLPARNAAVALLQANQEVKTTHLCITIGGVLQPIWAEYDTGKVICPRCMGKGIIRWAHKEPENCQACTEGYTGENVYAQLYPENHGSRP